MRDKQLNMIRAAAIVVALVCIGLGIAQGEVQLVLRKAVRICLECIGVG